MTEAPPASDLAELAAASDRAFVLATGGFSLELAGGSLVTHERIPVPRFNHILVHPVAVARPSGFFERALDHYFQRALRPTVRVREPVPARLEEMLRQLAFVRRPEPYVLRWARPRPPAASVGTVQVRAAAPEELDAVVAFWTDGPHRPELRRALDVLWSHPGPAERLVPLLAERDGVPVGSAVLLEQPPVASLHGVGTSTDERGLGVASSLVEYALGVPEPATVGAVVLATDSRKSAPRPERLGFAVLHEFAEFELPDDAELTMPSPGPPQPPRWRPPRDDASR